VPTARSEEVGSTFTDDETEEHDAAIRLGGDDQWIGDEVCVGVCGGVDTVVGDQRWGSGAERDLDSAFEVGFPGVTGGSSGIVAVDEVGHFTRKKKMK
jgi:hypothetical protein